MSQGLQPLCLASPGWFLQWIRSLPQPVLAAELPGLQEKRGGLGGHLAGFACIRNKDIPAQLSLPTELSSPESVYEARVHGLPLSNSPSLKKD